jgi:hypothetical protein
MEALVMKGEGPELSDIWLSVCAQVIYLLTMVTAIVMPAQFFTGVFGKCLQAQIPVLTSHH